MHDRGRRRNTRPRSLASWQGSGDDLSVLPLRKKQRASNAVLHDHILIVLSLIYEPPVERRVSQPKRKLPGAGRPMLAPKRTSFSLALESTEQMNRMKPKESGHALGGSPWAPVEMRMHGDGHGALVRIWASSRSRVWIPSSSVDRHRFKKKIYYLEHSRHVHIHR